MGDAEQENDLFWVPDPEIGYVLAELVELQAGEVKVKRVEGGTTATFPLDKVLPAHAEQDLKGVSYDDVTQLMYLHAASLLSNLKLRYMKDKIYTYIAHILVAVNPFQRLDIYGDEQLARYRFKSIGMEPPHIYAVSDEAFRQMRNNEMSQSMIVSGESGAGKTENCKLIMRYLASLGGMGMNSLEQIILEGNPILESVGNAKTTRNKNSSRFGKFLEMHFDFDDKLAGAMNSHYLLEKSRVTKQNDSERNYHIFYFMLKGLEADVLSKLKLKSVEDYKYLGKTHVVEGLNDAEEMRVMRKAMTTIGMTEAEQFDLFKVIAGVLHIGNIEFRDGASGNVEAVHDSDNDPVAIASVLLGCDLDLLKISLVSRMMSKAGNKSTAIRKALSLAECKNNRDALAKSIYMRMFDWTVWRLNQSIPFKNSKNYIGILDIAGFEYFQFNSFEQFCINFCNEKLQGFFNEKVLRNEQLIYKREGLKVKHIEFSTNEDAIDLIERAKDGIFAILDESSKMPKANDKNFATTLHEKHRKHVKFGNAKKSPLASNRKLKDDEAFLIRHYAGAVCYQVAGFIDKNNDSLGVDLETVVIESSDTFVANLYERMPKNERAVRGKLTFVSLGTKFKKQLTVLMEKLGANGAHFVRCIKPNMALKPAQFDGVDVLNQLHCGGMMEAMELMQKGYPSRVDFTTLHDLYKGFLPPQIQKLDAKIFCEALIYALGCNYQDFQFGLTKVFFRAGKYALLDQMTKADEELKATIVEKVRIWLIKKRWRRVIFTAFSCVKLLVLIEARSGGRGDIQRMCRGFAVRKRLLAKIQDARSAALADKLKAAEEAEKKSAEIAQNAKLLEFEERQKVEKEAEEIKKKAEEDKALIAVAQMKQKEERKEMEEAEEEHRRMMKKKAEDRKRQAEERRRKMEDEKLRKEAEERLAAYEKTHAQEIALKKQKERDRELALRLARTGGKVEGQLVEDEKTADDLSTWSMQDLTNAINESNDPHLLKKIQAEMKERMNQYSDWKAKHKQNPNGGGADFTAQLNAILHAPREKKGRMAQSKNTNPDHRYFRIPFTRPKTETTPKRKGLWWALFDKQQCIRQMETHKDQPPILLEVPGDEDSICDLTLTETGLEQKKNAEIAEEQFAEEWNKHAESAGKTKIEQ